MITAVANSQIQNLEEKLPAPSSESLAKSRMPFQTAYELTRDQEDALIIHALLRLQQIETQLGKKQGEQPWNNKEFLITCDPESFFGKREIYTARYYNHVEDRKEPDTIYWHSNLVTSLSQRIAKQMVAKASSFFFGQPDDNEWFTAEGIGIEDEVLADKVKKYGRFKAEKCSVKPRLIQGIEFSFVRGEAVIKTTHQERFQIYKRNAVIMVDLDGSPIFDAFGDYIIESDKWVEEMAETPIGPQMPIEDEAIMEPQTDLVPTGNMVLKRDGVTVMPNPEEYGWRQEKITRKLVTFEGPDARLVYYKDFLCPIDATSVQEADLVAHLYDRSVMDIAQMFSGQFAEGDQGVEDLRAAVELLRNMMSDSSHPKSSEKQPRTDFGEQDNEGSQNNPTSQIAECWLTYDADGDGIQEEIMLVLDRRNQAPIFYEYAANVTLRGLRPFEVIRPIEMDGRWYGMGAMEYFDPEQEFIDLQVNRKNFRDGGSGRVTFWSPWATLEGQRDPNLKLNNGKTYTLREGYKAEQALVYVTLPDDTGELMELIELFLQMMQLKSGVINPGDQKMSGLPTSETATGENLITESGEELFALFLVSLHQGINASVVNVVDVTFANLNTRQVFTYFNGEANEIIELTPDDVRDLAINVRMSITRTRDRQMLEAGNIADDVVDRFYARPLALQDRTADYTRNRLKALRVARPEKVIEPTDPALLMPPMPAAEPPADPMAQ